MGAGSDDQGGGLDSQRALVLQVLSECAGHVAADMSVENACSVIFGMIWRLVPSANEATINLLNKAAGVVRCLRSRGATEELRTEDFPLGVGHIGHVVATGRALLANDLDAEMEVKPHLRDVGSNRALRSALTVPVKAGGETIGAIQVSSLKTGAFSDADLDTLSILADHAAVALKGALACERVQRGEQATEKLNRLLTDVHTITSLGQLLPPALVHLKEIVPYDDAAVWIWDAMRARLEPEAVASESPEDLWHMVFNQGEGYPGRLVRHREGLLVSNRSGVARQQEKYADVLDQHGIRSLMAVPIWYRERFLGVLVTASHEPYKYDEAERIALESFAGHLGPALGEGEARERRRHGLLCQHVIQELLGITDRDEFLACAATTIAKALKSETSTIWLPRGETHVVLAAAHGPHARFVNEHAYELSEAGITPHVARTGEIVREREARTHPAWKGKYDAAVWPDRAPGSGPILCVPLDLSGKVYGVLRVSTPQRTPERQDGRYHYADELALSAIARFLTSVLNRLEAAGGDVDAVTFQRVLRAGAAHLADTVARQMALTEKLAPAAEMLGMARASVWLLDPERERLVLRAARGPHEAFVDIHTYGLDEDFADWAVKHNTPVFLNEPYADDRRFRPKYQEQVYGSEPLGCPLMVLPLRGARGVLGVVKFSERRDGDGNVIPVTDQEIADAEVLADQFAGLVDAADREAARMEQLDAIARLDSLFAESLDEQQMLNRIVEEAINTAGCVDAHIRILGPDGSSLPRRAACGPHKDQVVYQGHKGDRLHREVFETCSTKVIRDVRDDTHFQSILDEYENTDYGKFLESFRSEALVPLKVGKDKVLGILYAHKAEPNGFGFDDLWLLEELASRGAIAIKNADLREKLRQELRGRMTEIGLSRNLSQILTGGGRVLTIRQRILDLIVQHAMDLTGEGTQWANVRMLTDDGSELKFVAFDGEGWPEELKRRRYPLTEESAGARCVLTKEPVVIGDVQNQRYYIEVFEAVRSHASVPLLRGTEVIGVLSVDSIRPDAFKDAEVQLLRFLAEQASISLENANLFVRSNLQAIEQTLLKTVAGGYAAIQDEVAEQVRDLMGAEGCTLWIADRAIGRLRPRGTTGLKRDPGPGEGYEYGEGLTGWVWEKDEPLCINSVASHQARSSPRPDWRNKYPERLDNEDQGRAQFLGVPVRMGRYVAGVLRIANSVPRHDFAERDQEVLQVVANRIGARLKAERDAAQVDALSRASIGILRAQTARDMVKAAFKAMQDILDCPYGHVRLLQDDGVTLKKIVGRDAVDGLTPETRQLGEPISGIAAETGKPVVIQDTRTDSSTAFMRENPRYAEFLDQVRSEMSVPLKAADRVLGTLNAHALTPKAFCEADVAAFTALATLATDLAIGLANLRLRANMARQQTLASLGVLTAGIAHNIQTHLADIAHAAERIGWEHPPDEVSALLQRIEKDARFAAGTVKNLLRFSRPSQGEVRPCRVPEVLEHVLSLIGIDLVHRNIAVRTEIPAHLPAVLADRVDLAQAIFNVVVNARLAMGGDGTLTIRARLDEAADRVTVDFEDTGRGIPEDLLPDRLFEPFVTRRDGNPGIGLGLFTVRQALVQWGGGVRARNRPDADGAILTLMLPIAQGV